MKSLYKMGIEQVGRQFDGDAGPPLLYITLIVVSRQFDGGCSRSLTALWYRRSKCFLSLPVGYMIISALTPLGVGRNSSCKLVDGVVEFLHRERFHCVLVLLVLVLVFVVFVVDV